MVSQIRSMKDRTVGLMIVVALAWPAALCIANRQGPHACCDAAGTGECWQRSAVGVCTSGWVEQGNWTYCGTFEACTLASGDCVDIDVLCCDDVGGTAGGPASTCALESCCLAGGVCQDESTGDCASAGGASGGTGSLCSGDVQACCMSLTECGADVDCCLDADTVCCGTSIEGVSLGSGSTCAGLGANCKTTACCKPTHATGGELYPWCDNHAYYDCLIIESGVPDLSNVCGSLADVDGDDPGGNGVPDSCDNCEPGNPDHHCGFFDCRNLGQEDDDSDGVGDACDNCTLTNGLHHCDEPGIDCINPGQEDTDGDGIGDDCDNCPLLPNGPQLGTCLNGVRTVPATTCTTDAQCDVVPGDGVCSNAQENCDADAFPCDADPGVADCDKDGTPDGCNPNDLDCDGDGTPDECDMDIDDDGIDNPEDICDYSPQGLIVETDGVFIGSVRADLDGDCDVDASDRFILDNRALQSGGAACPAGPGLGGEDDLDCPACAGCVACDSCCIPIQFQF